MPRPKASSHPIDKSAKRRNSRRAKSTPAASALRPSRRATKHDQVLTLLRAKGGATIAALAKTTGWQPHSVRGFLAGIVRKKLVLNLTSHKTYSVRVYRISSMKSASDRPEAKSEPSHA